MEAAMIPVAGTGDPNPGDEDAVEELGRIEAALREVDGAMARLDDGSYGTCAECGALLADEVLQSDPTARSCPGHH
ncbi:MAG: hypothetical protein M3N37_04250 [Actinomycetota bacterium]|nr:hypothetical protein [Actinomycetota bacterium]